jgi:N-acetylmuramoyl-L-alanine amidase
MARKISLLLVHCAASPNGKSLFRGRLGDANFKTPVDSINAWHQARGFRRDPDAAKRFNPGLTAIGYHYVIYVSGVVVTGRHPYEVGAHCAGFNANSIGICMIGTDRFTAAQWASLTHLVNTIRSENPGLRVAGHRDMSPDQNKNGTVEPFEWLKTCPGFDVSKWLAGGMVPLADHLCEEVLP